MNYEIKFYSVVNTFESDHSLYIYDFGNVKGYLYDNEFKLFKILNKDFKENMYTEYCILYEQIPLKAISIEKYKCKYENNVYITPNYTISITPFFLPAPPLPQGQPQPQQHQPQAQPPLVAQPLHKKPIYMKKEMRKNETFPSRVSEKTPRELTFQQPLQQLPKHQWMSLERIMKHSSLLAPQQPSSQQTQVNQSSLALKQKSYQHLRQPRNKVQKAFQDSKTQHSLQVQNLALV
jgi:hypothetical protein